MLTLQKNKFENFDKNKKINNDLILHNDVMQNGRMIITYILLKIQSNDWIAFQQIISEKSLALKFNCSKSIAHISLVKLKNFGVLTSFPCRKWVVSDIKKSRSILNFDFYEEEFDFRISKRQIWAGGIKNTTKDQQIFQDLYPKDEINFSEMFFYKKVFYDNKKKISFRIDYGLVKNLIDFLEEKLLKNNLNHFLAINGHAIFKRIKKILLIPLAKKSNEENIENTFQVAVYEILINQNEEVILVAKKTYYNYQNHENNFFEWK